jgi:4-hydroxy-tetrahydrodipicolinate reductase
VGRAVEADPELELAARGGRTDPVEGFVTARCDVVVDFTVAEAARERVPWLLRRGVHAVVGTTGLSGADVDEIAAAAEAGGAGAIVAPNFAVSAVLMMRMAELAAPYFDTVEVIELHHDGKADAPSGTALATAERIAAARGDRPWGPDPTTRTVVPGARGAEAAGGIQVHSVRMRGMVAHQEVLFGTTGQTLTIRQDSYSAESFVPGVLLACRLVADRPGLTVGLDALLG